MLKSSIENAFWLTAANELERNLTLHFSEKFSQSPSPPRRTPTLSSSSSSSPFVNCASSMKIQKCKTELNGRRCILLLQLWRIPTKQHSSSSSVRLASPACLPVCLITNFSRILCAKGDYPNIQQDVSVQ